MAVEAVRDGRFIGGARPRREPRELGKTLQEIGFADDPAVPARKIEGEAGFSACRRPGKEDDFHCTVGAGAEAAGAALAAAAGGCCDAQSLSRTQLPPPGLAWASAG